MLERTLESPLDCKEIQPVHPKGDQSWMFIGRTDAKAETPVLWPPMRRVDSLEKTLMLGGIRGRRRRGQQRIPSVSSLGYWDYFQNYSYAGLKPGCEIVSEFSVGGTVCRPVIRELNLSGPHVNWTSFKTLFSRVMLG